MEETEHTHPETQLVLPGEFEDQEAVWMQWPPVDHLEGYDNKLVATQIIESLIPHVKVNLVVADSQLKQSVLEYLPDSLINSVRLSLINIPYIEFWTRDTGPTFLKNENGVKSISDFRFNGWGYGDLDDPIIKVDDEFGTNVASEMGLNLLTSEVISEGGNRESNGKGTLMAVEAVERQRNPKLSLEQIGSEYQRVLGVEKIIWLKEGLLEDELTFNGPIFSGEEFGYVYTVVTTGGHIDEFARFINPNTIMLASVAPDDLHEDTMAVINHKRMEENLQIINNSVDQDGRPFNVIRMPLPFPIFEEMKPGDYVYDYISTLTYSSDFPFPVGEKINVVAAASYLNFLISNNCVIAQKFWREGFPLKIKRRDQEAKEILQQAFPNREVIQINAIPINFGGGGIHCITMHEPK